MPTRTIDVGGTEWSAHPSGFVTQYDADEFGVLFVSKSPAGPELRVSRYRPAVRAPGRSLAGLSDAQLRELFARSQPSETSPEGGYTP